VPNRLPCRADVDRAAPETQSSTLSYLDLSRDATSVAATFSADLSTRRDEGRKEKREKNKETRDWFIRYLYLHLTRRRRRKMPSRKMLETIRPRQLRDSCRAHGRSSIAYSSELRILPPPLPSPPPPPRGKTSSACAAPRQRHTSRYKP